MTIIKKKKTNFMQQEILIVLHSSFAYSKLNKISEEENKKFLQQEKPEEACAGFLIQELLPDVFNPEPNQKTYLSQLHPGFYFLQHEHEELPIHVDKCFSINPHNFIITCCYN